MKKGKKNFHPLKGKEMMWLYRHSKMCGYGRIPKVNDTRTRVRCNCSLTEEACEYSLPQYTTDCKHYKNWLNYLRAFKGLEGKVNG